MSDWLAAIVAPLLVIGGAGLFLAVMSLLLYVFVGLMDALVDRYGQRRVEAAGNLVIGLLAIAGVIVVMVAVFMQLTGRA